ncbi:Putative polypeptide N-acetylgalactosaminyltransferase-like protein 3 [Tupaia chinensis]|uniref:Putative polypeptide N-acetylgalactosaminyltransferase-like protein 3 n=1 Tax=Tupaia chinensis TaxID=246437 RepID=L9KFX0_TUPCH|nr:Putative polypeptide N-acetylgalactosaminyltransferase-like protein 3 [Tupaia chinensis]
MRAPDSGSLSAGCDGAGRSRDQPLAGAEETQVSRSFAETPGTGRAQWTELACQEALLQTGDFHTEPESVRVRGKGRLGCLMASLRRVKVLLVLNLIAVAGFVLFLAKCRPIAVRSGEAFHEIRPRAEAVNLSAHSASPIQDAVLKRLSLLEDIVYRQLNGTVVGHRMLAVYKFRVSVTYVYRQLSRDNIQGR